MYFYDDIPTIFEIVKKNVSNVHLLIDKDIYDSPINKSMVNLNTIDINYAIKKVKSVILFLKECHDYKGNIDSIVDNLIYLEKGDYKILDNLIDDLFNYINNAFRNILNKETVYLSDILELYGIEPIYITEYKDEVKVLQKTK